MDIWHRLGRIVRFSNIGTMLFFLLNILLIVSVFGASGYIAEVVILYFVTVAISLSPLGEYLTALFADAKEIKRTDVKLRIVPLVQYVLDCAKEKSMYHLDSYNIVKVLGTAASRVYFHLKAETVRMERKWSDASHPGLARP